MQAMNAFRNSVGIYGVRAQLSLYNVFDFCTRATRSLRKFQEFECCVYCFL